MADKVERGLPANLANLLNLGTVVSGFSWRASWGTTPTKSPQEETCLNRGTMLLVLHSTNWIVKSACIKHL